MSHPRMAADAGHGGTGRSGKIDGVEFQGGKAHFAASIPDADDRSWTHNAVAAASPVRYQNHTRP